jgi:hypothetical protein
MPERDRPPFEEWLTERHRVLRDGLAQFVDLEAGLRAAVLHGEHSSVLSTLESHLDLLAGLAAILPPAAVTPEALRDATAAIMTADPAARVALRRHPVILAVILSDIIARAVMAADATPASRSLAQDLNHALAFARGFDLAPGQDLSLDIDLGLARARALAATRDQAVRLILARDLARDLANAIARFLGHDLDPGLGTDCGLDLGRALDLARSVAHDLDHGLAGGFEDNVTHVSDRRLGLDVALDLTRGFAYQIALVTGRALAIGHVEGLAAALLDGGLDDFTHADLTYVDLSGHDLADMRWSDWGTKWPPGTDVKALRKRSREVARGTGVYVITNPGDIGKSLHYVPA